MIVALDWDDTLVDVRTQEWLPDALDALKRLLRDGHTVIVHTCRANWPEGLASVETKLAQAGVAGATVWTEPGKPHADVYVDDRAVRFDGDWRPVVDLIRSSQPFSRVAETRKIVKPMRASVAALAEHPGWGRFPAWPR